MIRIEKKHKIKKIKRYREKFDFLKRFKKVFSNRRKNNDLSDRVKKRLLLEYDKIN